MDFSKSLNIYEASLGGILSGRNSAVASYLTYFEPDQPEDSMRMAKEQYESV
jgi:hypothetical protein